MSINNSQAGHSPSEVFIENNKNQSNIDQLLSVEMMAPSQPPPSSAIQFNPINMIANIQKHNNVLIGQHGRPGRQHQQQQEFRRRQEEQRRLRREQQQEQRERQRRRRERRERRYEQWQDRVYQRYRERDREEADERARHEYLARRSPTFVELTDEILQERQLDVYYSERMIPEERKEIWEQEHLNELQANPAPRSYRSQLDDLDRYAQSVGKQLRCDERDQLMSVYAMQNSDYAQQCRRNDELLMQKAEWEDIAFRLQQLP